VYSRLKLDPWPPLSNLDHIGSYVTHRNDLIKTGGKLCTSLVQAGVLVGHGFSPDRGRFFPNQKRDNRGTDCRIQAEPSDVPFKCSAKERWALLLVIGAAGVLASRTVYASAAAVGGELVMFPGHCAPAQLPQLGAAPVRMPSCQQPCAACNLLPHVGSGNPPCAAGLQSWHRATTHDGRQAQAGTQKLITYQLTWLGYNPSTPPLDS
jgi:hypothetical protein